MARITITNWSDATAKFGRSSGTFTMASGESDYWHIHGGSVYLIEPNGSSGFHAEEGDRYIVFKDHNNLYRFAYIGTDGYVSQAQAINLNRPAGGQASLQFTPQGMLDPNHKTDAVAKKSENMSNTTVPAQVVGVI